ncbi:MAG TPA: Bax inhibitor-1 family protein [Candidatus Absconditabacterales bacterium]|nr:Bax inhibitor-1 family protein [Candidatus Absconditabacterales bacterium]
MLKSSEVYQRDGSSHSMTEQSFYGSIAGFVLYGLIGTAISAHLAIQSAFNPGIWGIIILGLVIPIVGVIIAGVSNNWFFSFIGYNMVLIPFGLILAPALSHYLKEYPDVVRNAASLTAIITFVMGLAGTMFPNIFSRMGSALFFSLSALVLVRLAGIFIPELNSFLLIDYIAAGIFSLYIGYDMYRASTVERNLDNAVDIALSLYLDIINLFLELLKIMSSKDDD